ncbi:MAG: PPC domain-containing protein [Pirellulales bacterium]
MFAVDVLPEVLEVEPNQPLDKAQEVALESVINGRAESEKSDFYKFTMKKGQRLLAECLAFRADSQLDATLILYDATGNELARSNDVLRRDPLLDFTAPTDGIYVVEILRLPLQRRRFVWLSPPSDDAPAQSISCSRRPDCRERRVNSRCTAVTSRMGKKPSKKRPTARYWNASTSRSTFPPKGYRNRCRPCSWTPATTAANRSFIDRVSATSKPTRCRSISPRRRSSSNTNRTTMRPPRKS